MTDLMLAPDPIAGRIDGYLSDLGALDARYRADLQALYARFQGDIVTLIASGKHLPDGATVVLYQQEKRLHERLG